MFNLILSFALLASATTAHKFLLVWFSPTVFVGLRMLCAGFIFLLINCFVYKASLFGKIHRSTLPTLILMGALITFIPSSLRGWGLKQLISSHASLIENLDPFITALYGHYLWQESLQPLKLVGILSAFIGICILLGGLPTGSLALLPALAILLSVAISRYGWFVARDLLKHCSYHSTEINAVILLLGGVYGLIFSYCQNICCFTVEPATPYLWPAFVYSVLIGNVVGYSLYAHFVQKYNMTFITLCALTVPLFVHFYGFIVLKEPLSINFMLALACVLGGAFLFKYADLIQTEFDKKVRSAMIKK